MSSSVKRKYVSITSSGILNELGGISGPILNPVWIKVTDIKTLITNGRILYEHSIVDPENKIKLNKDNYNDFNIYPGNAAVDDPSLREDTYMVSLKDDPVHDRDMVSGFLYVELL